MLQPTSAFLDDRISGSMRALASAGVDPARIETLPFGPGDATGGSEFELQAAVEGDAAHVDLPLRIRESNYFTNVMQRVQTEEAPRRLMMRLEEFLDHNRDRLWENSWVRIPTAHLNAPARALLDEDLRHDRSDPQSAPRADAAKFRCGDTVRVPVSYLLKLALAHLQGTLPGPTAHLDAIARRLMGHFLNDNSSPETHSFYVSSMSGHTSLGAALARETQQRYLLTALLLEHANGRMGLAATGQRAQAWFSPHPPLRLRQLNDSVSDAFFRELFCSPCLSGWDRGHEKHDYMQLCHQVLSRSQLNTLAALREAGILARRRVVLPNLSSTSLANNGVHVSLGSERLRRAAAFRPEDEKNVGDLVLKASEHFLPLFVGTYSAAPYRLGFHHFLPEQALGYLPHELHPVHLRMVWRRWKKKARIGLPWSPTGNPTADTLIARCFHQRGDWVTDFRLIDYLVACASTQRSAALDGVPGNHERLKCDLHDLGIFDKRMSLYLPLKLREIARYGFSGFEARHYSLFSSLAGDMAPAVDLQRLVTLFVIDRIARGTLTHDDIPDTPFVESERRQVFFACALGIPTFFVRRRSRNRFLQELLARTPGVRPSRRYAGYLRVEITHFRRALCDLLAESGRPLVEALDFDAMLGDLRERINAPERSGAGARLMQGILDEAGGSRSPKAHSENGFNRAAERYYRGTLRRSHLREALEGLEERLGRTRDPKVASILGGCSLEACFAEARAQTARDELDPALVARLIALLLLDIERENRRAAPVR
ncbi:MAG: hypothetical protein AAGD14_05065 [Planctomycetota bacterium]